MATRRAECERALDKPGQDHTLEASNRRWTPADDRDGDYRHFLKSGQLGDKGKEKEDHTDKDSEREKEKDPAWMETYIPTDFSPGILGGQLHGGELDGVQALNRGLKDKEIRGRGRGRGRGLGRGGQGEDYRKPCKFFAAGRRALNKVNCQ